jgi:hypothetical protein
MVLCRDRLRHDSADRELYQDTKQEQEFAQRKWAYVQDCADAKTSVVEEILLRPRLALHHAVNI